MEMRIIDRDFAVDGISARVLHLRLDEEGVVHLEVLADLREQCAWEEELMRSGRAEAIKHPPTNREEKRNEVEFDWQEPMLSADTVEIGGVRFKVRSWSCRDDQPGWRRYDLRMRGVFETLPEADGPLRFTWGPKKQKILAEMPVTLNVGEQLQRIEDGAGRWINILEVGVNEDCGPVLVYECPEELTPKFCTSDYLAETPKRDCSAVIGSIFQMPKERGPAGLPLRVAFIEGNVPPDTKTIEAELFSWEKKENRPDILL